MAEILIPAEVCAPSVGIKNQVEDRWRGRTQGGNEGDERQTERQKNDGGCKVAHFAAQVGSPYATIMAR